MPIENLPLLAGDLSRTLVWRDGKPISAGDFLAHATALARSLPDAPYVVNLCEDRGHFLVGFCAALIAGRISLLPPSRAPQAVAEITAAYAPATVLDDAMVAAAVSKQASGAMDAPSIDPARVVVIGFTSGSTGTPKANPKTWGAFAGSTRLNKAAFERFGQPPMSVLATVPSQHMYGMETCVLLPVLGDIAVSTDRPMFPQDLVDALDRLPGQRLLVTTPVHLRAFVDADIDYPAPALIVSATAPLTTELAIAAERAFKAPLLEVFGSTETCVIGHRRTAGSEAWQLYPQLRLEPIADGTRVHAPYFHPPVLLHDHLRMIDDDHFVVEGRSADMIEIAGKRASLGDIGSRLLALPGIADAAVLQACESGPGNVQRIVAFVVMKASHAHLCDADIVGGLRESLDPVFLPRRVFRIDRLPRNETGKLRRDTLLSVLDALTRDD